MKKYVEILEDIKKEYKALDALKEEKRTLEAVCYPTWSNFEEYKKIKEATKEQREKLDSIYEKIAVSELRLKYMRHNAKHAVFNEVLPVLMELLKKYENKAAGPKTSEKFRDEFKAATGCNVYFSNDYRSPCARVYPEGFYIDKLEIFTKYQTEPQFLNGENRFNVPAVENIYLGYVNDRYFYDIDAAIQEARAAMKRAKDAYKALEEACDAFNVYAIDGVERATIYDLRTIRNTL